MPPGSPSGGVLWRARVPRRQTVVSIGAPERGAQGAREGGVGVRTEAGARGLLGQLGAQRRDQPGILGQAAGEQHHAGDARRHRARGTAGARHREDDDGEDAGEAEPLREHPDREGAAELDDDRDGDGMSNWQEYVAGTDPTDASSSLKLDASADGLGARLSFGAVSNRTYSVQYSDALGSGPWLKLADVAARVTNRTEIITDVNSGTNRFYRVVTPQQP